MTDEERREVDALTARVRELEGLVAIIAHNVAHDVYSETDGRCDRKTLNEYASKARRKR